ncbi:hypothetical protein EOM09_07430 [bacterium]|nr:hypothetical protein [bacterium]
MNKNNYWYKSVEILNLFKEKKFISSECGLNSTERKNLNRVARVLDELNTLNSWNLSEDSDYFFQMLKMAIIDYMQESGYKQTVNSRDKYTFKRWFK